MSILKGFFWNGVLRIDEGEEHSFFDINLVLHATMDEKDRKLVSLYSSDLPPIPIFDDSTISVQFFLENNVGSHTIRYRVAQGEMRSTLIYEKAEEGDVEMKIEEEDTKWNVVKQGSHWFVSYVSVSIEYAQLKKYIPL